MKREQKKIGETVRGRIVNDSLEGVGKQMAEVNLREVMAGADILQCVIDMEGLEENENNFAMSPSWNMTPTLDNYLNKYLRGTGLADGWEDRQDDGVVSGGFSQIESLFQNETTTPKERSNNLLSETSEVSRESSRPVVSSSGASLNVYPGRFVPIPSPMGMQKVVPRRRRKNRMTLKERREQEAMQFPAEKLNDISGTTSSKVRTMSQEDRELVLYKRKLRNRESARRSRARRRIAEEAGM